MEVHEMDTIRRQERRRFEEEDRGGGTCDGLGDFSPQSKGDDNNHKERNIEWGAGEVQRERQLGEGAKSKGNNGDEKSYYTSPTERNDMKEN